jgi:hypothetical protein
MRIIKLTESDLEKIVKKVLKEDVDALPEMENVPLGKVEAIQQALVDAGYDVGPTGVDGKFGSNTRAAVIKYQRANGIKQTGNVGPVTGGKLGVQPLTSGKPSPTQPKVSTRPQDKSKVPSFNLGNNLQPIARDNTYVKKPLVQIPGLKSDKATQTNISGKFSEQVRKQLQYMKNNNLLSNEKFTIVDDKNSQVHAFLPSYKLVRTYYVITGKNKGDQLKTQSMTDWVMKNWTDVGAKFFSSIYNQTKNLATGNKAKNPLQDVADYIDGCYFGQKEWNLKNTPSGVFKRAGNVTNFMNDLLATTFIEKDYGARFITWETCDGKTIPFGFHGTKNEARLPVLNAKNIERQSCSKRKMSFGCINFGDADVKEISSFITDGQLSIWLPDTSDNIVEIPSNCVSGSRPQKSIMSYDYMTQNYGKGFK